MESGPPTVPERTRSAPGDESLATVLRALDPRRDGALFAALAARALDAAGPAFDRVHLYEFEPRLNLLRLKLSRPAGELQATAAPNELRLGFLSAGMQSVWSRGEAQVLDSGADCIGAPSNRRTGAVRIGIGDLPRLLLVGEWDTESERSSCTESLERFAAQANELASAAFRASTDARRARHAAAIAELALTCGHSLNLAEALHLAARLACESTGSRGSAIWRPGISGAPVPAVTFGVAGERESIARALQPQVENVMRTGTACRIQPGVDPGGWTPGATPAIGSLAVVPVRAYERTIGVLAVYDRSARGCVEPPGYDEIESTALESIAAVLALVLEQAARIEELSRSELSRQDLTRRLAREEHLALAGERAARAAVDARNPLASIGAFARRVHRELPEESLHRESLEIVVRETERLEKLLGGPLERGGDEPLRLRMESLNHVVQDVLRESGELLVRRRVRLLKKLAPELPTLLLDPERVRLAIANVLRHALESVAVGGRIRIESRRSGEYLVVEVAHDGPRAPGEMMEQLFVAFASTGHAPQGVGLAAARQVIQEHGGEVRARAEAEWTSVISFTLPIRENEDRRSPRSERRGVRSDRRRRTVGTGL